ncbi:MAG: hypothetical protein JW716_05265 [Candidatus Aenigmarchaeota archaeon]|nr:hypothetical protein [Candidatus Aenigmarchaeota archaeon]
MGFMDIGERRKAILRIAEEAATEERAERGRMKNRNIVTGIVTVLVVFAFTYVFVVAP